MAKSLYEALRNGLIHHYDPKSIVVDGQRIELAISWRREPHLSLRGSRLYLNVQQMAIDLGAAFKSYEQELRADATMRERFQQTARKDRETYVVDRSEAEAWRTLLGLTGERNS